MQAPFESAWWSFDLGEYRPCDGTYRIFPYDSVPPLDEALFTGEFAWLTPTRKRKPSKRFAALVDAAARLGVALPDAFVRFMGDPSLSDAVPSCTACEWDPSAAPVPCRVVPGAYTVRFLRDQQDCLLWYLHLVPGEARAAVLCSPIPFDDPKLKVSREQVIDNTWVAAPHFEQFVYRFWLENELWDALHRQGAELTPAQGAYLEHYVLRLAAN